MVSCFLYVSEDFGGVAGVVRKLRIIDRYIGV